MTDSQSPPSTSQPTQSGSPKTLQVNLESATPLHGGRHQPLYFVLLLVHTTGQPSTSPLTMNPALSSVMPGRDTSSTVDGSRDSELSDYVNAFISPIFTMSKNEKQTFPGGFPLLTQQGPPSEVTFYFAVMRSHSRERSVGTALSDVMTKANPDFQTLASKIGSLMGAEAQQKKDEAADSHADTPATPTTTTPTSTTTTTTTTTTTPAPPVPVSTLATDAAAAVSPVASVIQEAASTVFDSIGAALKDRGDKRIYSTMATLRASQNYLAGTQTWKDDQITLTFEIDYS